MGLNSLPPEERPRERLWNCGAGALSLVELLAILLGTGTKERNVLGLAADLVEAFGGVSGLVRVSAAELLAFRGLGRAKASHVLAALELARRLNDPSERGFSGCPWQRRLGEIARQVVHEEREFIFSLFLDRRGYVLGEERLSFGGLEGAFLDLPVFLRRAVRLDAVRIVLAHNHPKGTRTPSREDHDLTVHVARRLGVLGIQLEGHFILAQGAWFLVPEA